MRETGRRQRVRGVGAGALAGALVALAYWPLLVGALAMGAGLEGWLFRPSELPAALVIGIAAWMVWRRRARVGALPARGALALAAALAAAGGAFHAWAVATSTADLLLYSLALELLAIAALLRGPRGCRSLLLPALILIAGAPLPPALRDAAVWQLQLWSASGAAWLLHASGHEFVHYGVMLASSEHTFHVIEGCSGWNGILILSLVALIVRELFAWGALRVWVVVALAPPLGLLLNAIRIAYVASSSDPEALAGIEGDHTPQGVSILVAGSALLYGTGWLLAGRGAPARARVIGEVGRAPATPWRPVLSTLALLVALQLALPGFARDADPAVPHFGLPAQQAGWVRVGPAPIDPLFTGTLPGGLHQRYRRAGPAGQAEVVDVLVGYDVESVPTSSSLLGSKLLRPGPDWELLEDTRETIWLLDRDVQLARVSSGVQHAVVYLWKPRYAGPWRESLRSLLALDASPLRRGQRPAVVRLVAYAPHDGRLALDRAKQRLDRFIQAFRLELSSV